MLNLEACKALKEMNYPQIDVHHWWQEYRIYPISMQPQPEGYELVLQTKPSRINVASKNYNGHRYISKSWACPEAVEALDWLEAKQVILAWNRVADYFTYHPLPVVPSWTALFLDGTSVALGNPSDLIVAIGEHQARQTPAGPAAERRG